MAPSVPEFPRLRPAALAAVVANVGIVLTGGIVRVTGSGLGCPRWPTCDGTSIVPSGSEDATWHQFIEFGNRTLTFVLLAVAIWVVWAARRDARDRRDLQRLAWIQPAGILVQAVLGGITVLTGLHPLVVASHFLLSMALIAAAVVLHDRVSRAPASEPLPALRWLTIVMTTVAGTVLVLGTLVTGSGPHAGDAGTERLPLDIRTMAFAHADAVWLLVGLTVATLVVARALGAARTTRAVGIVLAVEVAQGGIGYLQYALGVPAQLVSLHIVGAAVLWVVVLRARLATVRPVVDIDHDVGDPSTEPATATP